MAPTGNLAVAQVVRRGKPVGLQLLAGANQQALAVAFEHGARLQSAFRPASVTGIGMPDEVHVLWFPDRAALDAFRADPKLDPLAREREDIIERTVLVIEGEEIQYPGAP